MPARATLGCVLAGLLLFAVSARGQSAVPDTVLSYALVSPTSEFEWGCFAPCECPVLVRSPLSGTFTLAWRTGPDPVTTTTTWDVRDVRWSAPDGTRSTSIRGTGTYVRGGGSTPMERLTLDLSFDGGAAQRFDSGQHPAGAAFPEIRLDVSLHGEYCHDSVLVVDARPVSVAGLRTSPSAATLDPAPNPFAGSTRIRFTLPDASPVTLGVYDVSGRAVRVLAAGDWVGGGEHESSWDGRRTDGIPAPPGLYLVRLQSATGRTVSPVVKLH